jgi:hypothetical protein
VLPNIEFSAAVLPTFTVRLLAELLKVFGKLRTGFPVHVTVWPAIGKLGVQSANTSGLTKLTTAPNNARRTAMAMEEVGEAGAAANFKSTLIPFVVKPFFLEGRAAFQSKTG